VSYITLWHTPLCDQHYFVTHQTVTCTTLWHTLLCDKHYIVTQNCKFATELLKFAIVLSFVEVANLNTQTN